MTAHSRNQGHVVRCNISWNITRLLALVILCDVAFLQLPAVSGEITFIAERLPLQGDRSQSDVPWPMPESWSRDNTTFTLHPQTLVIDSDLQCDVIANAIERHRQLLLVFKDDDQERESDITSVKIVIGAGTCEKFPYLNMDETYDISVEGQIVRINSITVWGALRGLATFSQLVFEKDGKVLMKNWTIADKPRFPHRGFMIDTSRHYLPLALIKTHLDAMEWNKLNVLHWHIVDAQAFPYVTSRFPELSKKGAYTIRHVYTAESVSEVIEYARLRGIRVIPEFDSPGHAHSWGKGRPELLTPCWHDDQPMSAVYGQYAESENFDPSRETTFTFLQELMTEVTQLFKDQFVHAGLDEAYHTCWQSSPNISQFMKEKGFNGNYPLLEQYYVERALNVINSTGKDVIVWQDPIDNGAKVSPEAIVEIWKNKRDKRDCHLDTPDQWQEMASLVAASGQRMLLSSCWYLNYVCYGEDWRRFYRCDPHDFTEKVEEQALMLGGEACMWSEYVDATNFLQRAWPRAAAAAERLWSPRHVTDEDTAAFRLDAHRCRMVRRGIPAEPVLPGYCGVFELGLEPEIINTVTSERPQTCVPCSAARLCSLNLCLLCLVLARVLIKQFFLLP